MRLLINYDQKQPNSQKTPKEKEKEKHKYT